MKQFDINKLIEYYGLKTEDAAKVLFPNVKYPKSAFDRVLKGEALLDTAQLERLADYLGIVITDLFFIDTWKGTTEDGCLTLLKGKYKVKLNYNGVYISIYENNKLIDKSIGYIPNMTLKDFITYIDNQIKNYDNGNI